MSELRKQVQCLLCMGAWENQRIGIERYGIVSDLYAYPDNEKLWKEAGGEGSLDDVIYEELQRLGPDVLDISVDGTLFPAENGVYDEVFPRLVYETCEAIDLQISFDGYRRSEARRITEDKELFLQKLQDGSLEYSYVTHRFGERSCVMTGQQVKKLAMLSVELGIYTYWEMEPVYHEYVIQRLWDEKDLWTWSEGKEKEKLARLGAMWTAYLDRLAHANFDIQPVLDAFAQCYCAFDMEIQRLKSEQEGLAEALAALNRSNARQLELMNGIGVNPQSYPEFMRLSQEMFDRLYKLKYTLANAAVEDWSSTESIRSLYETLNDMADRLDDIALHHFYDMLSARQYKRVSALCLGGAFVREVARSLPFTTPRGDQEDIAATTQELVLECEYDLRMLCSFGSGFNLLILDDDTAKLHPDVVDYLYPDA